MQELRCALRGAVYPKAWRSSGSAGLTDECGMKLLGVPWYLVGWGL